MKKRWIATTLALGIGLAVMIPGAEAQSTTPPYANTIGIMVDSINGDTNTTINCFTEGYDGRFATTAGDGTLIMVNRLPHSMYCVINIKKTYTTS